MPTVHTFGDSILDCARYNAHGVHPGALLVRNGDARFPEFRGRDLASALPRVRLEHRAQDGATIGALGAQARGLAPDEKAVALLTIGGNDLLGGLALDRGPGIESFRARLERWLELLPVRPVLVGSVYDPTFGDDAQNFLGVDPALPRANLARVNGILAEMGRRFGAFVDLHGHFLARGDPTWFTQVIEPSLVGASEVRRCFLPHVERALGVKAQDEARAAR